MTRYVTTATAFLAATMIANPARSDSIMLDIDADGASDEVAHVVIDGDSVLQFSKASGQSLQVHGINFDSVADLRILPPTDLDSDGQDDLVISDPSIGSGRVWVFSAGAGAGAVGSLDVSTATFSLQSSMPGAMQFGESLGLLPGSGFGAPPCLRVRSLLDARDGSVHPRIEVFRLDSERLLFVAEGHGPLTEVWTDRADATRDGKVTTDDFVASLARIGSAASFDGDLDGDGVVTGNDAVLVATDAAVSSGDAETHWQSVTQAMLDRAGGVDAWGMPIATVSSGPEQQPEEPSAPEGTGVFYCARPIDGWYENWPSWLAPFCHAYLQIDDWTRGFGGGSPSEDPDDGRSRKCWEAKRADDGTMVVDGETINCADATIEQIQECVMDLANSGGVCDDYGLVCNNCGDWVMDIIDACCLDGSYLPYLIY